MIEPINCNTDKPKIIYLGCSSDFKVVDGKLSLKRKYGKLKRKLVKIELNGS